LLVEDNTVQAELLMSLTTALCIAHAVARPEKSYKLNYYLIVAHSQVRSKLMPEEWQKD